MMVMIDDGQTIYALASGRGRSGVAVIRVSGGAAGAAVTSLSGSLPVPRRAVLRDLISRETGERLDCAIVLWLPGPGSFTGEDSAEFHVHGGPSVIAAVLEELGSMDGLRPAEAGEFTRRAFANGRLDLTQVEGLADLINAETEAQRRQALRQMEGRLADTYERWRNALTRCLAYLEAEIDFPDESDVPDDVASAMKSELAELGRQIDAALRDERRGERLRDGLCVVIAGRPNVGKSSLLNALAERDAAIVSETAGTTRDVIEVHMDLRGYPVNLIDTAGLRETADDVERQGVARTRVRLEDADLVLWVSDAEDCHEAPPKELAEARRFWTVMNKIDLVRTEDAPASADHRISARTGAGLGDLVAAVAQLAACDFEGGEGTIITRTRHRRALQDCRIYLTTAEAAWGGDAELVAEDLRLAARALGRVTGRVDVEDLLDVIFADFCIGK